MDDSAIVEHQNHRKRSKSKSDSNAFAKFVPLGSPLGDEGELQEPNTEGRKRLKPNSDGCFSEIARNFSSSFLHKKSIISDDLRNSSPSTSSKHSGDTRPSPSSIASKSNFQYEELDVRRSTKNLSTVSFNWKDDDQIDMGSLGSLAAEQLSKRPKVGEIYQAIRVHQESTVKRLKDLCIKEPTIDVGIEMADAASLLRLMSFSTNEIEIAGEKALKGAMLLLQAEILRNEGQKLLSECQDFFRDALQ